MATLLPLRSIWCIPAAKSRVVAVIARYSDGRRGWTHVLRWKVGRSPEPGAWARLNLIRHRCEVDASGEFLKFVAKDRAGGDWATPGPQHFRASNAGGMAISRLPWLSALTDVAGLGAMGGGAGDSKHALSATDQAALWAVFPAAEAPDRWFMRQQPGWRDIEPLRTGLVADSASGWYVSEAHPKCWRARQSIAGEGCLEVALPVQAWGRVAWLKDAASARFAWREGTDEAIPMNRVAWAWLAPTGALLVATKEGVLREYRRGRAAEGKSRAPWEAGWRVRAEYDLSRAAPDPGPSPRWARASL